MFIKIVKCANGGKSNVYLTEGYRDVDGKIKHRNIKRYGELTALLRDDPMAIEKLKAEAESYSKSDTVTIAVDLSADNTAKNKAVNYGYFFLENIYRSLDVSSFLAKRGGKHEYDIDEIFRLLVISRILRPGSKKETVAEQDGYFNPYTVKLEDVYRSLDVLADLKDDFTLYLHKKITRLYGRDCSLVFYDVTNYYFESEDTRGLRQKGVSKEKRDTGIVQMGLFIDNNGIPITYELFPGNTNDLSTMKPVLEKIKARYGIGKLTIVADKGNNSGSNLGYVDGSGDGYIVSQRIRYNGSELAAMILEQDGYTYCGEDFKYKTKPRIRRVKTETGTDEINENIICFWSKKEQDYQRAKRVGLDAAIREFVENPSLLKASNKYGVKRYIKTISVDAETGQVKKVRDIAAFDEEKYRRDTELDGYYAIVTNDLSLTPLQVIEKYRGLWKIEESFRVLKSDLKGRPMYVWTDNHIKGHFLTCFAALTILRIMEHDLSHRYPAEQLQEALRSAVCTLLCKDIYLMSRPNDLFREIEKTYGVSLPNQYARLETILSYRRRLAGSNR